MGRLSSRVIEICDRALAELPPDAASEQVTAVRERMVEPLRVAVAGRVSAGKSTLVNALLAKHVAPTAAGETTLVVAWFRYGFPERAEVALRDGRRQPVGLIEGALPEDLGVDPAEVAGVTVWLSNEALSDMTVIDTPGLSSANEQLSAATESLLQLDSRTAVAEADALVYVTTHRARGDDADALASFRSRSGGNQAFAMNSIAVLNKADMIGGGRSDPFSAAERIASEASRELGSLVGTVIPAVGLWAETALTALTERDTRSLRELSTLDREARAAMLRSVAHFERTESVVSRDVRIRLIELLGLVGIGRCLEWIDDGHTSAVALSERLERSSGIATLRGLLQQAFTARADALKADMGLGSLEQLTYMPATGGADVLAGIRDELDDVRLDPEMHQLNEAWALREAAAEDTALPDDLLAELQRIALGRSVEERLGCKPGADATELQRAAADGAARWRAFANSGRTSPTGSKIADVACRSYEGLWDRVASADAAEAR